MKPIFTLVLKVSLIMAFIYSVGDVSAQCGTDQLLPPNDYNPPMQNIRVNIHFMQANGGNNFTATDDGTGNTGFTGYDYAQDLVNAINNNILGQTEAMNIYVGSQPPTVHPKKWKVTLNGVYFHNDPTYKWYADVHINGTAVNYLNNTYGQNVGNTINIYSFSDNPNNPSCCGYAPGTTVLIAKAWDDYVNQGWGAWAKAALTAHEIGHNLSLSHTITSNCTGNCDDGCSDTPTYNQAIAAGFTNPLQWNSPTGTNNMMGYNASGKAVTPCQLKKVYKRLMNSMSDYTTNSGCEYTGTNLMVSQNETWDKKTRTYGNIVVQSGAHLTVKCSLLMSTNAYITVEEGATLTVDGGVITTTCGSQWKGITVLGNYNDSQYPLGGNYLQGRVICKNNAVIEHAKVGISAPNGGIVQATNSQFLNNKIDSEILYYTNSYPANAGSLAGLDAPNLSFFTNCDFHTTQPLNTSSGVPDKHLFFYYVDGIKVTRCNFKNTIPTNSGSIIRRGYGIYSDHASIKVRGTCNSIPMLGSPCPSYDRTVFDGLAYGIYATSSNPMNNISVTSSLFNNNWRGVYVNGMDHSTISLNIFNINTPPGNTWPFHPYEYNYGVYIRGSVGYEAEENEVNGPNDSNYGIVASYTNASLESTEEIYKNTFTGINAAVAAYGRNDGLLIRCNEFNNSQAVSIAVENYNGSIANPQGNCSDVASPAGNYFDHTPCALSSYEIWNGSAQYSFTYSHHDAPSGYVPQCAWNTYLQPCNNLSYDPQESCRSHIHFFHKSDKLEKVERIKQDQVDWVHEYVESVNLIDGGDKPYLLNEINTQQEAASLLNDLANASPYLSDEVMFEMISVPNVLNHSEIASLLIENSPLTEAVMQGVNQMEPRMDPENLALLNEYQTGQSKRNLLEESMLVQKREIELLTARIIRMYIDLETPTESSIWQDHAIDLLHSIDNDLPEGLHSNVKVKLAYLYLSKGDLAMADGILAEFEASTNNNNQSGILRMEIAQRQQGKTIFDVVGQDLEQLAEWAEDLDKNGHASASGILASINETVYPEEFSPISTENPEERKTAETPEMSDRNALFTLFPNPTNGKVTIAFEELINDNRTIQVYSITGQLVHEIPLTQSGQVLDLSKLDNGFYFIHYGNHTEKIILSK